MGACCPNNRGRARNSSSRTPKEEPGKFDAPNEDKSCSHDSKSSLSASDTRDLESNYRDTRVRQSDPRSTKPSIRDDLAATWGHATRGMDTRSFNSMSPLIQDHTALGTLLHALMLRKGIRGPLRQMGRFVSSRADAACLWPPFGHRPGLHWRVGELRDSVGPLNGSREVSSGDGRRLSSQWRLYFRLQISLHQQTAPCTPYKCAPQCVQVPAEARVSAHPGLAAASHPILQRYSRRYATLNRRPRSSSHQSISQRTPEDNFFINLRPPLHCSASSRHRSLKSDLTLHEACSSSSLGCDAPLGLQTKSNCFNVQPTGQPFGSRFSTLERRAVYRGVCSAALPLSGKIARVMS